MIEGVTTSMLQLLKNVILLIFISLIFLSCSSKTSSPTETNQSNKTVPYSPQPGDNAIDQPVSLALSWNADSTAKFDVYFDQQNPPQTILANGISSRSFNATNLNNGTIYYWKVTAAYDDGSSVSGPIWRFTTISNSSTTKEGYALYLDSLQTSLPNTVNVMFHVTDLYGQGITNLTSDGFLVYEDSQPLTQTEFELQIKRYDAVPYIIKTVLMLDNSTSLQNDIDIIRDAAATFINNLLPNQEVAVFKFSENIEMLSDFTSDKNILKTALQQYTLGNASTNLYGAVTDGTSLWQDTFSIDEIVQGSLIIFTDGNDTQGSSTLAEAVNAVRNKSVFTIGLGNEIQPEILEELGTAGYYPISNADQLTEKLNDIQNSITTIANSFYFLSYKSPKRGNFNHILTIKIKNNPYTGDNSSIDAVFNSNGFSSAKINSF